MARNHRRSQQPANFSPLEAKFRQGMKHMGREEWDKAGECFIAIMKERPDHYRAIEQIGVISKELKQYEKASEFFKAVIGLAPLHSTAYGHYATCMMELDRVEEAMAYFREALKMGAPSFAHIGIALCAMFMGDKETARQHTVTAMEMEPDNLDFLHEFLHNHHKFSSPDDPYLARLHEIERTGFRNLDNTKKARIYTLLYQAYEDLKDYDKAFAYAEKAGITRKLDSDYDIRKVALEHRMRIKLSTPDFFATTRTSDCNSDVPVFILGMPRSGTTLLEQIMHAHKDIKGIGEDSYISEMLKKESYLKTTPHPSMARGVPMQEIESLNEMAGDYLQYIQKKAPGAKRIVNKAITNLHLAGFLYLMFPKAYFIYIKRHALDSCLSTFFRSFKNNSQPYSNDLRDLGIVYAMHCQLMEHWHKVLPTRILDVSYEDMVEDTEGQAHRIIEFLNLPWDDNCLKFYETKKVVKTASLQQVRQPIYKTAMDSWKKYEKHVGPLAKALGAYLPEDARYLVE